MKIGAVIQARLGSSRLPGKVLKPLDDTADSQTVISLLLERLKKAKTIDHIILATSTKETDDRLADYVNALGVSVFRGSESDVLHRFWQAAEAHNLDIIVRITGDCPFIDPDIVDKVVTEYQKNSCDYASNIEPPTYPDGLDVEVFSHTMLREANDKADTTFEREHVTPFMRAKAGKKIVVKHHHDLSHYRWTVDEFTDLQFARQIYAKIGKRTDFTFDQLVVLIAENPDVAAVNEGLKRNEGAVMGEGVKLWRHAQDIVHGGNMLLSKRPDMYLPGKWPSYFKKSKGCEVWDIDGNHYYDMCLMGVGTNILGYAHDAVDEAVTDCVRSGMMSTLNAPEEVYLADRLLAMHPFADMARFARTGGEANAIAMRIARAASGRDNVAFCGYHGWHDWYLAANLVDDNQLKDHLLPGLKSTGVPRNLQGTVYPFQYNDYDTLAEMVDRCDIGVIMMEVMRNDPPKDDFLHKVRKLADEKNIVLMFDECTSGFRESFGGLHLNYDVEPDIAIFGKALGNGFAITAVLGKADVMRAGDDAFISSTFWSERVGYVAALKTLDIMEETKSWEVISSIGDSIRGCWSALAEKHNLPLQISGLRALSSFSLGPQFGAETKTFITQEMLKRGYLATTTLYCALPHTSEVIAGYQEALDDVFGMIAKAGEADAIKAQLEGPVCQTGFKRLN